jgi:hypothetical protein
VGKVARDCLNPFEEQVHDFGKVLHGLINDPIND